MSDPQDLLYTNKFISTDILTDNQLIKETQYYDRFKNYIDNNLTDEIQKYVENDEYETSAVNIDKTLNTKWPIYSNKNHYPLFDSYANDISSNRYKKEVITKINIDSRYRNISKYTNTNSFSIQLDQVFNNVKKIVINDIIFTNINQAVTNINNNLSWQYVSENFLVANNIDYTIIPTPSTENAISYSNLPNSVYKYGTSSGGSVNVQQYLVYQTVISPGYYYSTSSLIKTIRSTTNKIVHGLNYFNNNDIRIVEQPYISYPKRLGTPHLFSCSINPINNIVKFVNRIEEVKISAIQTFSPYESDFQNIDIFYNFSSKYNVSSRYTLNTSYIYIILPAINDLTYQYYENINCIYTPNAFPLVITDLNVSPGNIDPDLINYTEFYDLQIYLQNGFTENDLNSISFYKYIDTLTFITTKTVDGKLITFTNTYLRFALSLSTGNVHGNIYNINGTVIRPSCTNNILFSNGLNKILYNTFTSGIDYYFYDNVEPSYIGRALLFRWIYDFDGNSYLNYEFNTENEKKTSLLKILAWPIANKTDEIYIIEENNGFKFVHTNYQQQVFNKESLTGQSKKKSLNTNNFPYYSLQLQYYSNQYFFIDNNYIFLKIYFDSRPNLQEDSQYINTVSAESLLYNQVYINSYLFNVEIGQDYTCLSNSTNVKTYKKDQSFIFTKILLSDIPGNTDITLSNIIKNNSYYIYYDNVKDNINYLSIELYDPSMKLLFTDPNFSFTVNIHEVKDILKETLINSKSNNVTTTGHFI
jgi:hypothetical protein